VADTQGSDTSKNDLKIELWTDKADATYRIGDEIKFFSKQVRNVASPCWLAQGAAMKSIYPNGPQKNNYVPSGAVYNVPDQKDRYVARVTGLPETCSSKAIAERIPESQANAGAPYQTEIEKTITIVEK